MVAWWQNWNTKLLNYVLILMANWHIIMNISMTSLHFVFIPLGTEMSAWVFRNSATFENIFIWWKGNSFTFLMFSVWGKRSASIKGLFWHYTTFSAKSAFQVTWVSLRVFLDTEIDKKNFHNSCLCILFAFCIFLFKWFFKPCNLLEFRF